VPRPWLAVVLSLFPGLGHVYSGRVVRAVCIVVILKLAVFLVNWLFATGKINLVSLLALAVAALGTMGAVAFDAYRMAKRGRIRFFRRATVVTACLAYVLLSGVLSAAIETPRERYLGETFYVPSGSMLPTLLMGDRQTRPQWRIGDKLRARG
jgi:hypothetical protein